MNTRRITSDIVNAESECPLHPEDTMTKPRIAILLLVLIAGCETTPKDEFTRYLFEAPEEKLLLVSEITVAPEIPRATRESITCPACREQVSKNRIIGEEGKKVCIPCSE